MIESISDGNLFEMFEMFEMFEFDMNDFCLMKLRDHF